MISNDQMPELLTRQQAAEILGIQPQTLAAWASKSGPKRSLEFVKIGRLSRYRREDIAAFIEAGKQSSNEKKHGVVLLNRNHQKLRLLYAKHDTH